MKWTIDFGRNALRFLRKSKDLLKTKITQLILEVLHKFKGREINVDVRKMAGAWKGFYRIKKGKTRVIIKIDFDKKWVYVDKIDFRGKVYKK